MKTSSELIAEGYRNATKRPAKRVTITASDIGIKDDIYTALFAPAVLSDLRTEVVPHLCARRNCFMDVRSTWADDTPRAFCYKHRRHERGA